MKFAGDMEDLEPSGILFTTESSFLDWLRVLGMVLYGILPLVELILLLLLNQVTLQLFFLNAINFNYLGCILVQLQYEFHQPRAVEDLFGSICVSSLGGHGVRIFWRSVIMVSIFNFSWMELTYYGYKLLF